MSPRRPSRTVIPAAFSASLVLQFLGAVAAYLAAWVVPLNYPEIGTYSSRVLLSVGTIFLLIALLNLFVGAYVARVLQRAGMRSRVWLPREGLVYLGVMVMLAVAALLGHNNMLLLLFGMMAGPLVINGWVVMLTLSRLTAVRRLPPYATAGEFFSVEVLVRNDKRWMSSRGVEVRDVIAGQRLRQEASVAFVRIMPRSERSGSYQMMATRRGVYQFGPLRISSRFPLGIGERGTIANDRAELLIHPAIGRLLPDWLRRERELSEAINQRRTRPGVFDDEFHRIREFRTGDNPRSIHWRSTARHGELMVAEYEQQRESDLVVLLDLCEMPQFRDAEAEMSVSLAATICVEQTRRASSGQYRLLIAGKDHHDVQSAGAGRFREAALGQLALCRSSATADLDWMLSRLAQHDASSRDRFILITPRPQKAGELISGLSAAGDLRAMSLLPRTTIVPATLTDLRRVFLVQSPDAEANDHDRGLGEAGHGIERLAAVGEIR